MKRPRKKVLILEKVRAQAREAAQVQVAADAMMPLDYLLSVVR